LKALKTDAAWTCNKPELFEFGGVSEFIGQHYMTETRSGAAIELGSRFEVALAAGDLTAATGILLDVVESTLYGIQDDKVQDELLRLLGECLVAHPGLAH